MKKTIEVSMETWNNIKEQMKDIKEINQIEDMIGNKYYFRTVTYHQVGRVVKQIGNFLQLEDASWVAESGRFMQAIKNGSLSEVEPVGTMFINIDSLVDLFPWIHNLPKDQL